VILRRGCTGCTGHFIEAR